MDTVSDARARAPVRRRDIFFSSLPVAATASRRHLAAGRRHRRHRSHEPACPPRRHHHLRRLDAGELLAISLRSVLPGGARHDDRRRPLRRVVDLDPRLRARLLHRASESGKGASPRADDHADLRSVRDPRLLVDLHAGTERPGELGPRGARHHRYPTRPDLQPDGDDHRPHPRVPAVHDHLAPECDGEDRSPRSRRRPKGSARRAGRCCAG